MRTLIVYAHPSKESFTYQVLNQLKKGLLESAHEVEISDLYQIHFRTDMSESEYRREGLNQLDIPISNDVQLEHQKLKHVECVFFLYPVWWSDCPAKLKGWFDRVYSTGFAYSKNSNPRKMKTIEKGIVICTAGHSNKILKETEIAESMRKIMLNDRLGDRFKHKQMIILGGTLNGIEAKEKHLKTIFQLGKKLEN